MKRGQQQPIAKSRSFHDRLSVAGRGPTAAAAVAAAAAVVVLFALFGPDGSLSLLGGPIRTVTVALTAAGVLVGVAGRPRRWWATWGTGIAVAATVVVASAHWWLMDSGLVDQHYPPTFLLWVWGAMVAVGVAGTGWWSGPAAQRAVRVVTVPIALFASFLLINAHYGYWPTMGALLNRPVAGQVSARALSRALSDRASGPIREVGQFGRVSIPGPAGYDAGTAWAWIPPAFNRVSHAHLPVLVMLPGVPGWPYDWEQAGQVVSLANAWARAHGGIAPVMLLVSGNGARNRDTECVNGPRGNAETYLTRSVPDFITHQLGITEDPARWGIVGYSEGGTCAFDLALEHPHLFGRFVDIAGDLGPNIAPNTQSPLTELYAGNFAAMLHHETRWLLAHHRYPHSQGWFASSSEDRSHERIARTHAAAAASDGMKTFNRSGGTGGHSWSYAGTALRSVYPALVTSMPTPTLPPTERNRPQRHHYVADPDHRP